MDTTRQRTALVVCLSDLENDPRVVREIEWLAAEGWVVDTLGLGKSPSPVVRDHFEIQPAPAWTRPLPVRGAILSFLPFAARFRVLEESGIPTAATARVENAGYELVIMNDIDLLPWAARTTTRARRIREVRCHLDLHEFHPRDLPEGTAYRFLMTGYHRWLRHFIGDPAFTSRSVVAGGIGQLYASEFHVPVPGIVRNSPPYIEQSPTPVNAEAINLIYHGHAAWARGLGVLIEAMRLLEKRFVLHLMLTGSTQVKAELETMAGDLGDRVTFLPAVPLRDVSGALNRFDLEVMFFPPTTQNLRYALPNKLFEAVQGRLGLVIGESPSMVEIVDERANGVVVSGWRPEDLADRLNRLGADEITAMKAASDRAAHDLSSEGERLAFLRVLGL